MKKISIMIVVGVLLIGGGLGVLAYWNLWPFQGDKIAGVPNGALIKKDKESIDTLDLLLAASGKVAFNTEGERVQVYLDVYEKAERVSHQKVVEIAREEKSPINGELVWGAVGFDMMKPEELRVKILANGAESQKKVPLSAELFHKFEHAGSATEPFEGGKIEPGKRYVLQYWGFSEKGLRIVDDLFAEEALSEMDQSIILYVMFK
ncbi:MULTISPECIES: hypothetical protein [unclassified Listeria]|uniref:hypothetical protein n=1 Tax=unclassified Listeria TaxID=2642072 RepID=UPI000B594EE2|nr:MULTISPECIES: hypothetical protein [unclassified Listeria]